MNSFLASIKPEIWIAIGGFLLGLGTTVNAAIIWYSNSVKKRYAAERDFEHMKNNYKQLAANQHLILEEIDETKDTILKEFDDVKDSVLKELVEIKALLYSGRFNQRREV
jgi:dGTP triphosphohydrolase